MAQEFENPGSEYHQPKQRRETEELRTPAPETAQPAGEFGIDRKSSESAKERKAKQKEQQKKRHKLLKKMVYAAASAVAVVALSRSVGTQSAAVENGYLVCGIGMDGIYLIQEDASEWVYPVSGYLYYSEGYYPDNRGYSSEWNGYAYEITYYTPAEMEQREGISFDPETYTLLLEDFSNTYLIIQLVSDGEKPLTVQLEGTNEIGRVDIRFTGEVIFTGQGSLEIVEYNVYHIDTDTYSTSSGSLMVSWYDRLSDISTSVYIDNSCSITTNTLRVVTSETPETEPLSGNAQWDHEYEYGPTTDSYGDTRYYSYYYDVVPMNDDSSDASTITANDDTTLTEAAGETLTEQSEGIESEELLTEGNCFLTMSMDCIELYYGSEVAEGGYLNTYEFYDNGYQIPEDIGKYTFYGYEYEDRYLPSDALEDRGGISYDMETNTLTLDNFESNALHLWFSEVTDLLTIRLEGSNTIGVLSINNVKNILFTGDGSLECAGYQTYDISTQTSTIYDGYIYVGIPSASDSAVYIEADNSCSIFAGMMQVDTTEVDPLSGNVQWDEKYNWSGGVGYTDVQPKN